MKSANEILGELFIGKTLVRLAYSEDDTEHQGKTIVDVDLGQSDSREYGVSKGHIDRIVKGKTWKNV